MVRVVPAPIGNKISELAQCLTQISEHVTM
jgi:hypothetical protein